MPTKTPVGEPCSDSGQIPARSSTSQHSSSTSRCCGSTATASRGLIPKNPGSNSPASCSTPPSAPTPPAPQQLPQQLRRHRTPRETAAHRHHRNRLITLFFSCAEALVTLVQVERLLFGESTKPVLDFGHMGASFLSLSTRPKSSL